LKKSESLWVKPKYQRAERESGTTARSNQLDRNRNYCRQSTPRYIFRVRYLCRYSFFFPVFFPLEIHNRDKPTRVFYLSVQPVD